MMSRPERLAAFLESLPASLLDDETLELVIAGDFIDFLAIPEQASWTPDPYAARDKLVRTMTGSSVFAPVFAALARLVEAGHRITILIGNHDVELALPQVQDALLAQLGASRHQVLFVDDGRAYRIGRALIEHGNRYDGANVNDWTGLRVIASALSRGEEPPVALKVSAGSLIVENVINHIKPRYPFIDLLQPQGELVALLLVAFEPALAWQADKLARILQGKRLQGENLEGIQPGRTRNVADQ
jgi:UDP-2,3-diacylglucosamine pyrophosphatase LpxH